MTHELNALDLVEMLHRTPEIELALHNRARVTYDAVRETYNVYTGPRLVESTVDPEIAASVYNQAAQS